MGGAVLLQRDPLEHPNASYLSAMLPKVVMLRPAAGSTHCWKVQKSFSAGQPEPSASCYSQASLRDRKAREIVDRR